MAASEMKATYRDRYEAAYNDLRKARDEYNEKRDALFEAAHALHESDEPISIDFVMLGQVIPRA